MDIPKNWSPIINTKVEVSVVEEIANAVRKDINEKMHSELGGSPSILNLYYSPVIEAIEPKIAPYILVDRTKGATVDEYDDHGPYDENANTMNDLFDVCFIYRENKQFVLSFLATSFLVNPYYDEESLKDSIYFMQTLAKKSVAEFLRTLTSTWTNNAIDFIDLRGENNELVLDRIEYDIGYGIGELKVFSYGWTERCGLLLRYYFNWTKPQKYAPPQNYNKVGGRGFNEAKERYEETLKKVNKK